MPESKAKIDFAGGQQSSNEQLAGAIPQSVNVLVDGFGAMHLRPGISAWSGFDASPSYDADTSVDGISVWNGYPVYVTSDRRIHAQVGGAGIDLSDATAATQLDGTTRPVIVPTRTRAIFAGGGLLQKWEGPAVALSARLGGSPPATTHVVAISQRLVINPVVGLSGQIQWSGPGETTGHETWIGEFMELESLPDPLPAIYTSTGEIIGFGTESVQTIAPEPQTIFQSIRTWSSGTGAPYSFAANDETFGFVDSRRRIQFGNGRAYQAISDMGITESIQGLSVITDCWGFRMQASGWNLLGWHFPTDGRTFVWDLDLKRWYEWRGYSNGQWVPWRAKSHFFWEDQKLDLVGLGDGTIAKMDATAVTDMGDPIVADVYSGFNDHGVSNWKQHITTRFMFRRGVGAFGQSPSPKVQLFWRDDTGAWEDPYELDLGNVDDKNPVVEARSLGTYQTRQWRLRFSDNVPLTFVGAEETVEILEN